MQDRRAGGTVNRVHCDKTPFTGGFQFAEESGWSFGSKPGSHAVGISDDTALQKFRRASQPGCGTDWQSVLRVGARVPCNGAEFAPGGSRPGRSGVGRAVRRDAGGLMGDRATHPAGADGLPIRPTGWGAGALQRVRRAVMTATRGCCGTRHRALFQASWPPQDEPAPAVHPKQWLPVRMGMVESESGSTSQMKVGESELAPLAPAGGFRSRSSIWLKSQS